MSKKTIALASAVLAAGLAASASAHEKGPTVTLGGFINTQVGYQNQKHNFNLLVNDDFPSGAPRSKFGIVNDTKVHIKADGHKGGLKYGGMILLNTDTSNSKDNEADVAHQTMVYAETAFGRLEAGSYIGAYDALRVGAPVMGAATGGIDGDWNYWPNLDVDGDFDPATGSGFNTAIIRPTLPTSFDLSFSQNSSRVTYYTPVLRGFQAGLTYIPDTEQHGTITNLKRISKDFSSTPASVDQTHAYKNVFQGGLAYSGKFDKVEFKFSALGEVGTAKKDTATIAAIPYSFERKDLRAWELGASAHYMGFGLGGSYGDWGKSGLVKSRTVVATGVTTAIAGLKAGKYWAVGANYGHAGYTASIGYFASETGGFGANFAAATPAYSTAKGKADVFSFGLDYKLAPGFMPYAEVSHFTVNNKAIAAISGKNRGNVGLAGVKLSF